MSFLCLVVHLEGSTPTKYGLLLNNDDRYKDVKRELSKYCGLVCSQLLLVEIFGASVKVQCSFCLATLICIWFVYIIFASMVCFKRKQVLQHFIINLFRYDKLHLTETL